MSNETDELGGVDPTSTHPDRATELAQSILDQALAAHASTAEEGLINQAEDWVRKNSHPEEAGAILDLIQYAREMLGEKQDGDQVDKSEWLFAWQMLQQGVWNLIGMQLPNGQSLPMVTMNARVAHEMESVARAHAEAARCPVRLISFVPGAILQLIK